MDFKKLIKTYKTIIILSGVILISFLCFVVGIVPLAKKSYDLWQSMDALQKNITILSEKISILQSLDDVSLRSNLGSLTDAVPTESSLATIFTTLDGVSGNGIIVKSFDQTKPGSISTGSAQKLNADSTKVGANILPFSVTVSGPIDQVQNFLTRISQVRRLFKIRGADLTFTTDGVEARTELNAFYVPFPKSIGGVTSPITPLNDSEQASLAKVSALPLESSYAFVVGTPSAETGGKADPFSP